jgi:ferredoxin-type protein NapF
MAVSINRAQFLRGDLQGRHRAIRPPWSIAEEIFVEKCTRCDDCIKECPTNVLVRGRAGFPEVNFSIAECTFCGACLENCMTGALHADQRTSSNPWPLVASIENNCLANKGIECRICAEQCEVQAIRIRLTAGSVAQPVMNYSSCNGCGACYRFCPEEAIMIKNFDFQREAFV